MNLKYFRSELIQSTQHSFAIQNSGERHGWYWCKRQQEKAGNSTFLGEPTFGGPGGEVLTEKQTSSKLILTKQRVLFQVEMGRKGQMMDRRREAENVVMHTHQVLS